MELIPAVKNGFQTASSFTNSFSSAQLTFYEQKSKDHPYYLIFLEEANTAQIQSSFLKSFLGSGYD